MFKMAKSLSIFLLVSALAILASASVTQYPTYMWTKNIKGKKIEYQPEISENGEKIAIQSSKVSEEVQNILDNTKVNSFIVYQRPGMTTENLVDTMVNTNKIGSLLKESKYNAIERSFPFVTGDSVATELTKKFENVKNVIVDSKESFEDLKKEFSTAPKPFIHQYYIVDLPVLQDSSFDELVFQIEKEFATRTLGNHVSLLSGTPLEHRQLQEVDFKPVQQIRSVSQLKMDNYQYTTANILTKVLVTIPIVFLLIGAISLLFNIKTPTLFVEKGIDFGKIEK